MISSGLAMCVGPVGKASTDGPTIACASLGQCKLDTVKPVSPALGAEPRPVAPSSRISPPAPVAAPSKGLIAVGWLWVSTFINTCRSAALAA